AIRLARWPAWVGRSCREGATRSANALPSLFMPSDGWAQPLIAQETVMGNAQQSPRIAQMLLACLWLVFPATVTAQSSTAAINGKMRDPSGSIVPGADVVLTNTQTNVEQRAVTNEAGIYVFLNVIPGEYHLRASKTGFKTSRQPAFTLVVNQTATFDFNLD